MKNSSTCLHLMVLAHLAPARPQPITEDLSASFIDSQSDQLTPTNLPISKLAIASCFLSQLTFSGWCSGHTPPPQRTLIGPIMFSFQHEKCFQDEHFEHQLPLVDTWRTARHCDLWHPPAPPASDPGSCHRSRFKDSMPWSELTASSGGRLILAQSTEGPLACRNLWKSFLKPSKSLLQT